jgi:hypothetical protein
MFDLRASIFAVFYRVGFDLHELSPSEKQTMEIIQLFPYLKNGEIWRDIAEELREQGIRPTTDDHHWLMTCVEEATEQAENSVYNQTLYLQEMKMIEQEDLESYYSAIRLKNMVGGKQNY